MFASGRDFVICLFVCLFNWSSVRNTLGSWWTRLKQKLEPDLRYNMLLNKMVDDVTRSVCLSPSMKGHFYVTNFIDVASSHTIHYYVNTWPQDSCSCRDGIVSLHYLVNSEFIAIELKEILRRGLKHLFALAEAPYISDKLFGYSIFKNTYETRGADPGCGWKL